MRFELTVQHNCTLDFESKAYHAETLQVLVNVRHYFYASRGFLAFRGSDDRFLHAFRRPPLKTDKIGLEPTLGAPICEGKREPHRKNRQQIHAGKQSVSLSQVVFDPLLLK